MKFTSDTKLECVANTSEERELIQRELGEIRNSV